MGGKGRKRREKNYRAAHGGYSRLPPPPNSSQLDALPAKLRKLMSFTSSPSLLQLKGAEKVSVNELNDNKRDGARRRKLHSADEFDSKSTGSTNDPDDGSLRIPKHEDNGDEIPDNSLEKRKKKRKREQVEDLQFKMKIGESGVVGSKRRERKKRNLEARKSKLKKANTEEDLDFPGHEKIKFGEVVEAPPKLLAIPKASKSVHDASNERLRLRTVEAYRNRKGWASRPGIRIPPPVATSQLF